MDLPNVPGRGLHPIHSAQSKYSIVADPKNPNIVFTGGDEAGIGWRGDASKPSGQQWELVSSSPAHGWSECCPIGTSCGFARHGV